MKEGFQSDDNTQQEQSAFLGGDVYIPAWDRNGSVPPPMTPEYGMSLQTSEVWDPNGAVPPPLPAEDMSAERMWMGKELGLPPPLQEEVNQITKTSPENASGMKERIIETPELLSEKETSKKFLAEDRAQLAAEIRASRKEHRDRIAELKTRIEIADIFPGSMEGERGDSQYGKLSEMQSDEANALVERLNQDTESSESDTEEELMNLNTLIDSGESIKTIKEKIEAHYAKADELAKEKFDTLSRSIEHVASRNKSFIVHVIAEGTEHHNANSNISTESTYEDDIDLFLSLEPSVSTSSVIPGEKSGLWTAGDSGFLVGGGQIGEAGTSDVGSRPNGIKSRGGENTSIEKIDEIVGRQDEFSRKHHEDGRSHSMNELVVNNPEAFGFFQYVNIDADGNYWQGKTREHSNASVLKNNLGRYRNGFSIAQSRGLPLYVMTPDRRVLECVRVNDDGTVEVGKELTPEEVATGRAGLPPEKRKEIGARLIEKRLFRDQKSQIEAEEIIGALPE